MEWSLVAAIFAAAVCAGVSLIFAGLGELITEKSGVLNLGVEGTMLVGALAGFATAQWSKSLTLGIVAALWAGAAMGLLHAVVTISWRGNQIVSGLAMNILGSGLTGYFGKSWIGTPPAVAFSPQPIPWFSQIPWVGPVLFSHNLFVYASYLLVPLVVIWLYKTDWGLRVRACGENPAAADSMGIAVNRLRYLCTMVGGMLMGAAGAYLSLAYTRMWGEEMCGGRGWIAIALVIFASWRPSRLMAGAYLFGAIEALQLRLQASGQFTTIPVYFLAMLPYLFTILVLVASKLRQSREDTPLALARPFVREEMG